MLTLAAVCAVGFSPTALRRIESAEQQHARHEIKIQYHSLEKAFRNGNMRPILQIVAPQYWQQLPSRDKILRRQWERDLRRQRTYYRSLKVQMGALRVIKSGQIAIVSVRSTSTMSVPDARGVRHAIEDNAAGTDTWRRTGSTWRLQQSEVAVESVTLDGKPWTPPPSRR